MKHLFTPVDSQPITLEDLVETTFEEREPIASVIRMERTDSSIVTPESTRDDDIAGFPFRLADGQVWHLARPSLRIRPKFANGKVETINIWDYPRDVRAKVQALLEACESQASEIPLDLIVDTAFNLVRLCHRLEPEHAASLFELSISEVEDLAVGMVRMFRGFSPVESTTEEPANPEPKVE